VKPRILLESFVKYSPTKKAEFAFKLRKLKRFIEGPFWS